QFIKDWLPILDVARDLGLRFAFEVHPGQFAFDLYSTELLLDAFAGREEFGLTFDPSHLHWQGVDPVEFLRRFPDRIYHVHMKDAALTLNGRAGLLTGYWPSGDPRRGFQFRSMGRGGIDWEAIIRGLNAIGYDGPLAIDWHDAEMEREQGVSEACQFVRNLDFDPPARSLQPFRVGP
ncbi:MAG: sugar phosphate isomerase/epimerase family protein, partial [Gemmataceae bacterium]